MTTHVLKIWPRWYAAIFDGSKTFEVRRDDRGFQAGDRLVLCEYDPERGVETGYRMVRRIGFIFRQGFGVDLGEYVVLSLLPDVDPS